MPLSKIQIAVLRLLAACRDPESYVGGSTPLNRSGLRFSGDIDIFQDRLERVVEAALIDAAVLAAAGYGVEWLRQLPAAPGWNGSWIATVALFAPCVRVPNIGGKEFDEARSRPAARRLHEGGNRVAAGGQLLTSLCHFADYLA